VAIGRALRAAPLRAPDGVAVGFRAQQLRLVGALGRRDGALDTGAIRANLIATLRADRVLARGLTVGALVGALGRLARGGGLGVGVAGAGAE
jgi:hypothetical protein